MESIKPEFENEINAALQQLPAAYEVEDLIRAVTRIDEFLMQTGLVSEDLENLQLLLIRERSRRERLEKAKQDREAASSPR